MTELLDCGHAPTKTEGMGTGYGRNVEGKTFCYDCSTEADKEIIRKREMFYAYVSTDGKSITNWPGRKLMRVTAHWTGEGFWGYKTHYFNAVAEDGSEWYGKNGGHFGGEGCAIMLKPAKRKL